ncbi:MAG: hypothetical protein NZ898_09675 [Myxococcota bacterium]|nr:hypothetical protein [Myxococcota bacterium]MDW8361335.1 hypothetical protein [Myxococcales bacterium]
MTREILASILARAPGVEGRKNRFEIAEGHELTVYVGRPGQAMQLGEVGSCILEEGFVEVRARDERLVAFVRYDDVSVVAVRPPRAGVSRRAGF